MPVVVDEDSLSEMNNPFKQGMEEEKLGNPGMETAEKRESVPELGDSSQSAGGERDETVTMEGKQTAAEGGGTCILSNHAAEEETEFFVDTVAGMYGLAEIVVVEEEDGDEMKAAQSEDPPLESSGVEECSRADDPEEVTMITDIGDTTMFTESKVDIKVDEWLVDTEFESKTEEEFAPAVDAKLEMFVTDSESRIETKADEEFSPVVETKEEVVVNDVGDTQQLSELQTDAREDDFQAAMDGTDADDNKFKGQVCDGKNNHLENQTIDSWMVVNNAETVVGGDKFDEEKIDAAVNDSKAGTTEKPADIEDERVDFVITGEILGTGVETDVKIVTEVNTCIVDRGEEEHVHDICEHVEDKHVAADETLISGTEMVEDESMGTEVLGGSMLDKPVNIAEKKDAAKKDLPEGGSEAETEKGVELDLTRNTIVADTQLDDAEDVEGTDAVADKTSDEDDVKMDTEETNSEADEPGHDLYESQGEEEDETMVADEENEKQDTEMEIETDIAKSGKTSGGKRKRGKLSKSPWISKTAKKASSRKTVGEDVCFICFDGGELVLCDRRGCPKAYHPSCVNRDEAFFKSKGSWNCGWHLCSCCEKNARYMCFTCTFSLCKGCIKDAIILCVRGNKGFCETCMRTVKLIESNEQGNADTQVDFDDRSSWEYLFKDYYLELKDKLSLSEVEIAEAKNPWKGAEMLSGPSKQESPEERDGNDGGSGSDDSIENIVTTKPKRRKIRKSKTLSREEGLVSTRVAAGNSEWASKELLEFVKDMKDGDMSFLSQFDVQALLLEYIKRNKLRDPRRKSQIICDARLENLFGKPRVGHFEMLKLLESHFLVRDEQNDDFQGTVVDTENNELDIDGSPDPMAKGSKDRKRKSRKRSDRGCLSNLEDYASIDMHNIGLIYLRRKLMEDLLEDADTFHDKVIGTFVRIRISGSNQKQDMYRLVPVVGTSKAAEPYKIGKKSTDTMVEVLNLDKTEIISIDTISNQEFTEDECKRLRQSIKCGLIRRLTVGEILDKTMEIQVARVNDWLESEVLRLSHLRDRASDLGRRKELRECVEKLQLLKTPEERRRRVEEIPEIHADPKMDPCYESDDNDSENEDSRRDAFMRSKGFSRRGRGPISPGSDNSAKLTSKNWDSSKYLSTSSFASSSGHIGEIVNENSWNLERDKCAQESFNLEKPNINTNFDSGERAPQSVPQPESISGVVTPQSSLPSAVVETAVKINESEKIWHYKDPSAKVQGPFSMVQLRKWNNTGYFPADLRIWRATENQDETILLTDALEGKFPKRSPAVDNIILHSSHQDIERSKFSSEKCPGSDTTNLHSPTPKQNNYSGWNAHQTHGDLSGAIHRTPGGVNVMLSSPTPVLPNIGAHFSAAAAAAATPVGNPIIQTATVSPTPNSQHPTVEQHAVFPHPVQMHAPPADPIQPVISQNPQGSGWGTSSVPQNSSSGSFSNTGAAPIGLQPDAWGPTQGSQPNMSTPNATWAMWPPESNTLIGGVRPENPNMGWGMVQCNSSNMGWGNFPPGGNSTNMNWGPPPMPVPIPGNASSNWIAPPGNNTAGANNIQNMMPGYANPGWSGPPPPPVRGPPSGNAWGPLSGNAGPPPGSSLAVQGQPPQGNTNQGGSWGGGGAEQNHMGGQFLGPRGGRGGGSGFNGRPGLSNRQSTYGGGNFRKRDMVCPYNANGRCVKGVRCNYIHT